MGGRYCRGCGSRGSAYPDFVRWRMKRKILSLVIFAACLILFCLPCFAGGLWNAPLIDIADGILSDDEISEITALAKDAAEKNKASVGIIFVDSSLSRDELTERADALYDDNCDQKSDAIILAVDVSSRQYYIRQIGKMNSLKSSAMDNIENAALKGLKKSDWYSAATGFIESIAKNAYFSNPDDGDYSDDTKSDIVKKEVIIICVSIVISLIATGIMAAGMNNAKPGRAAANYVKKDSFKLGEKTDMYLYSTVTKVKIETESKSSSGGGGGGGSSRGGRGGSF